MQGRGWVDEVVLNALGTLIGSIVAIFGLPLTSDNMTTERISSQNSKASSAIKRESRCHGKRDANLGPRAASSAQMSYIPAPTRVVIWPMACYTGSGKVGHHIQARDLDWVDSADLPDSSAENSLPF